MRLTRVAHNIEAPARQDAAKVELPLLAIDQDPWEPARQHAAAAFDAIDELLNLLLAFKNRAPPRSSTSTKPPQSQQQSNN